MEFHLTNEFDNNIKKRKCVFNDEEIKKILNEKPLIENMRKCLDVYNGTELGCHSGRFSYREALEQYANCVYINNEETFLDYLKSFKKLRKNNIPSLDEIEKEEELLKINYNKLLKDSVDELREDIQKNHGYLLESCDDNGENVSSLINLRKLLRIVETKHYKGKQLPKSFKNDNIKVAMNNMYLPEEVIPIQSIVKEKTVTKFCNNGKNIITCNIDGPIEIYKYNDILKKYDIEKSIKYDSGCVMVDILISKNYNTIYAPTFPGTLSEIIIKNIDTPQHNDDRNLSIYLSDNNKNGNIIRGMCFRDLNEDTIICASTDGNVYGYDLIQSQLLFSNKSHYCVNDISMLSPNNCNVFVSAGSKCLNIFDCRILKSINDIGSPIAIIGDDPLNFKYISSRGDGNYIVGTCSDNIIKIYDIRYSNKNIFDVMCNNLSDGFRDIGEVKIKKSDRIYNVCKGKFSPSHTGNRFIYTGSWNGNILIFDLYTGSKVKTIKCNDESQILTVDWHPFKNQIVAGTKCGNLFCISDKNNPDLIIDDSINLNNERNDLSKMLIFGQEYERHFPILLTEESISPTNETN